MCVRACSRVSARVHLVGVRYVLCASSFASRDAAWNVALGLAIMSLGKIFQLNCFDPAWIKRTENVFLSHNTVETSTQSRGSSPDTNKSWSRAQHYFRDRAQTGSLPALRGKLISTEFVLHEGASSSPLPSCKQQENATKLPCGVKCVCDDISLLPSNFFPPSISLIISFVLLCIFTDIQRNASAPVGYHGADRVPLPRM